MFDKIFIPTRALSNLIEFHDTSNEKHEASTSDPRDMTMMEITHEHSLPIELEKQVWFADSDASHHLTPYAHFLHTKNFMYVKVVFVWKMVCP